MPPKNNKLKRVRSLRNQTPRNKRSRNPRRVLNLSPNNNSKYTELPNILKTSNSLYSAMPEMFLRASRAEQNRIIAEQESILKAQRTIGLNRRQNNGARPNPVRRPTSLVVPRNRGLSANNVRRSAMLRDLNYRPMQQSQLTRLVEFDPSTQRQDTPLRRPKISIKKTRPRRTVMRRNTTSPKNKINILKKSGFKKPKRRNPYLNENSGNLNRRSPYFHRRKLPYPLKYPLHQNSLLRRREEEKKRINRGLLIKNNNGETVNQQFNPLYDAQSVLNQFDPLAQTSHPEMHNVNNNELNNLIKRRALMRNRENYGIDFEEFPSSNPEMHVVNNNNNISNNNLNKVLEKQRAKLRKY